MSREEEERLEKLSSKFCETPVSIKNTKVSKDPCEEQTFMQQNKEMEEVENVIPLKTWCLRPSTIVHILVMIFGNSAWIGVNGIFIQLPLLINSAPEGWKLAAYLAVIIQIANIAPITYTLFHKFLFKINESHCIFGMLGIGSIVMGLLALLYDKTSNIAGKEYSLPLLVLTFFIAAVSCSSSVLFMPYLRNFKEVYLVSYFIGEGLSGVLPSVVALIQGINENHSCNNNTANSTNEADKTFPRFSSQHYFVFLFVSLILSLVAFFLLNNLLYVKKEKITSQTVDNNLINSEIGNYHCQKHISVLSEDLENDIIEKDVSMNNNKKTEIKKISNVCYPYSNHGLTLQNLYLYVLLSVICLLANGLLIGLQPYSCLSYGNMTYHLSATFSQIANPTACLIALWFLPRNKKIINWLSLMIFIISSYIIYLALVSPTPPLQNSNFGKTLVILSWILLVGLISYVKLIITSIFRRKSKNKLFHVGLVMQVGSACGAMLSFILTNFTNLLKEYKSCDDF